MTSSNTRALVIGAGILAILAAAGLAYEAARQPPAADATAQAPSDGGLFARWRAAGRELPAGTNVTVRLAETIDSGSAREGESVDGRVVGDVQVDGQVVIPDGSEARGEVIEVRPARHFGGQAAVVVAFREIRPPAGGRVPVEGTMESAAKKQTGKDAATIAGSAVGGAILGEIIDGEPAAGAVLGGGIGTAVASRKGKEAVLEAGRTLVVRTSETVDLKGVSS
jgi:hypothetical protein